MADIPKDTLEDACQLVKANSIQVGADADGGTHPRTKWHWRQGLACLAFRSAVQSALTLSCRCCWCAGLCGMQGNKASNVGIVYTPASNLRKTDDMATGQVRSRQFWVQACRRALHRRDRGTAGRCLRACQLAGAYELLR
jgi:hypothetical protein